MAAMAVNPRSQASTATGQCLQRYLAATMVLLPIGFCTVNLYRSLFDVSDGQFRCKINRTSSKFTAFNLNIVERSEDLLGNYHCVFRRTVSIADALLAVSENSCL